MQSQALPITCGEPHCRFRAIIETEDSSHRYCIAHLRAQVGDVRSELLHRRSCAPRFHVPISANVNYRSSHYQYQRQNSTSSAMSYKQSSTTTNADIERDLLLVAECLRRGMRRILPVEDIQMPILPHQVAEPEQQPLQFLNLDSDSEYEDDPEEVFERPVPQSRDSLFPACGPAGDRFETASWSSHSTVEMSSPPPRTYLTLWEVVVDSTMRLWDQPDNLGFDTESNFENAPSHYPEPPKASENLSDHAISQYDPEDDEIALIKEYQSCSRRADSACIMPPTPIHATHPVLEITPPPSTSSVYINGRTWWALYGSVPSFCGSPAFHRAARDAHLDIPSAVATARRWGLVVRPSTPASISPYNSPMHSPRSSFSPSFSCPRTPRDQRPDETNPFRDILADEDLEIFGLSNVLRLVNCGIPTLVLPPGGAFPEAALSGMEQVAMADEVASYMTVHGSGAGLASPTSPSGGSSKLGRYFLAATPSPLVPAPQRAPRSHGESRRRLDAGGFAPDVNPLRLNPVWKDDGSPGESSLPEMFIDKRNLTEAPVINWASAGLISSENMF
ncbi:hypothetical protein Cpir12675_001330 [Ceratocystis pirilliformis]|uniref:Uncharacterized protein n=1 Tax=Ceratocystis pirilliformis TaxID=259994 RepID=A0ABR3ZIK1_9PEZI